MLLIPESQTAKRPENPGVVCHYIIKSLTDVDGLQQWLA